MSFLFTNKPPQHWNDLCVQHGDLFNTSEWHRVLSDGFGSKTVYGWDEATSTGLSITVFKAGPFRIGYLGFPVGGMVANGALDHGIVAALRKAIFPFPLHCVRIPVTTFAHSADLPLKAQATCETVIENLHEWRHERDARLSRDIDKAKRSALQMVDVSDASIGNNLFNIYRDTVFRHSGNVKYTERYFCALLCLAKANKKLRCMLAIIDGEIAGFIVAACHQNSAYYLHAGTNQRFKHLSPSDLLLYEAICWAKEQGMKSFNMMSSPINQPLLVRYKEKWGGVTREQKTYDLALRPFHTMAFKAAATLYQRAPKFPREMA